MSPEIPWSTMLISHVAFFVTAIVVQAGQGLLVRAGLWFHPDQAVMVGIAMGGVAALFQFRLCHGDKVQQSALIDPPVIDALIWLARIFMVAMAGFAVGMLVQLRGPFRCSGPLLPLACAMLAIGLHTYLIYLRQRARWIGTAPIQSPHSTPPELGLVTKCSRCQAAHGPDSSGCPWCAQGIPPQCLSCCSPLTEDGERCTRCDTPAGWYTPTPRFR